MALSSIRRRLPVIVQEVNAEAHRRLVERAKAENLKVLARQKQRVGYEPAWEGFGDTPGRPVEAAKQKVVYKYTYLQEMISVFLQALRDASPSVSGKYKASHHLYIGGHQVPDDTMLKPGDDIWISNPVPYARRLEIGKRTSGKPFLLQVDNRIYERTARKLGSRYSNAAKVEFGYVTMPDAWEIKGKLPPRYRVKKNRHSYMRKRRQNVGGPVRAPAIIFSML